ncbi:hypothetical protein EGW08_016918 [Elysia chlorotica]|uniref:Peptidase M4 C-terminal domain-containing protein n=1 Tax=Elysia chlorotica TaxID=188477 RepID=A0A3S1HAB8_ELYCH|nr:hypothetical protein EGW08_016918 [Elysia chlorotica]
MNEAFSDMAGEVTEAFLFGKSDMVSGAEMFFAPDKALRYFDDPTKDGVSIKHVSEYRDGLDVHYSSGVYNHVFFRMNRDLGIRASFQCFLTANRLYWRSDTDFEKGACGVIRGAYDGGYDMDVVAKAFKAVGLTLTQCPRRESLVTAELRAGITQTGLVVSDIINPLFKISVPSGATQVTVASPDGLSVALSTSYRREDPPLSSGSGSATAPVESGQVIYARFFRGVPTRVSDATATLTFA